MDEEQRIHMHEQLRTLQRRLRVLERQRATFGAAHIPAHIELEIEDVQAEVGEIEVVLDLEDKSLTIPHTPVPPSRRTDYYAHIMLPPNYVPRAEVLAAVRKVLLVDVGPVALTSALRVAKPAVLHGMGGIGKSVIARALCDDPAVQSVFPDGILWATMGQTPDRIGSLRSWIQVLGGAVSESAPTIDSLKGNLARLLANRACLLVVDDIWKRADAEAFQVGSSRSRLLITTRDEAIAEDLGAKIQRIPVLNRDEAIALLEEWSDGQLVAADASLKERIVARLGYLPLGVKLAGAQLRRKQPTVWLQTFDVRRLASRRPEDIHDSLELTFGLSLDTLRESDRRLYTALAIFKEDEAIPEPGIMRLWQGLAGLDSDETSELLDDLAARALFELNISEKQRVVRLHDLLREFISADFDDTTRTQTHQILVDTYRMMQAHSGWHSVPDDGYLYDHLAFHLEAVGAQGELRKLFADQEWMKVRVAQKDYTYDGYLEDLDRARIDAELQIEHHMITRQEPYDVTDLVGYALIRTSINSIAANYPPSLVARALELGLWSARRALSIAASIPDPVKKVELYIALLSTGKLGMIEQKVVLQRSWDAIWTLNHDKLRIDLLIKLAPYLQEPILNQALEFALKSTILSSRIKLLSTLGPLLSEPQLEKSLELDLPITNSWRLSGALPRLAPFLTEAQVQRALEKVLAIKDFWKQGSAIAALAPRLSGVLLEKAFDAVLKLEDVRELGQAFAALAPQLSGAMLERAMDAAWALESPAQETGVRAWLQPYILSTLAPQLNEAARARILDIALDGALEIKDDVLREQILRVVIPQLEGPQIDLAFDMALRFRMPLQRAQILATLAPRSNPSQLKLALHDIVILRDAVVRASLLREVAPYISKASLDEVLQMSIINDNSTLVHALKESRIFVQELEILAPILEGNLLERALDTALQIESYHIRARAVATLAPQLSETLLARALTRLLDELGGFANRLIRPSILDTLAPYLSDLQLERVLNEALIIQDIKEQERAVASLVGSLPSTPQSDVLDRSFIETLTQALNFQHQSQQYPAIAALASKLTSVLPNSEQPSTEMTDHALAEHVLLTVLPYLTGHLLQLALHKLAQSSEIHRAHALVAIAPRLSKAQAAWGLRVALTIKDEHQRADVLRALAPQLKDESLALALEAALALQHGREQVLLAFLPALSGLSAQLVLRDLAGANEEWRVRALIALAPRLTADQVEHALSMALSTKDTQLRLEALVAFAEAAANNTSILQRCAQELYSHMRGMKERQRRDLLTFCAIPDLFSTALFREGTALSVAHQIEEICDAWQWM